MAAEERHGGGRRKSRKGELARTKPNHNRRPAYCMGDGEDAE